VADIEPADAGDEDREIARPVEHRIHQAEIVGAGLDDDPGRAERTRARAGGLDAVDGDPVRGDRDQAGDERLGAPRAGASDPCIRAFDSDVDVDRQRLVIGPGLRLDPVTVRSGVDRGLEVVERADERAAAVEQLHPLGQV
jgi:hypothetical protein